jgi:hypothetical protein
VLAVIGWLRRLWLRRRDNQQPRALTAMQLFTLLGAVVMTVAAMVSYSSVAMGTDQGRLLFPSLAPIALLLVAGWGALFQDRGTPWLVTGLGVLMTIVAAGALWLGIGQTFAPPSPPDSQEIAQTQPVGRVYDGGPELMAIRWETGTRLTLYWQAQQPIGQDLRIDLRLVDGEGQTLWEWKRSPAAGRFSTDRWPVGRLVVDRYDLPVEMVQQAARAEVGVYEFTSGASLDLRGGGRWTAIVLPAW